MFLFHFSAPLFSLPHTLPSITKIQNFSPINATPFVRMVSPRLFSCRVFLLCLFSCHLKLNYSLFVKCTHCCLPPPHHRFRLLPKYSPPSLLHEFCLITQNFKSIFHQTNIHYRAYPSCIATTLTLKRRGEEASHCCWARFAHVEVISCGLPRSLGCGVIRGLDHFKHSRDILIWWKSGRKMKELQWNTQQVA